MTIPRVNGSGWGIGDKLSSAQATALDVNGVSALDKRAGQTDSLASVVSCTGAGRLIGSYAVGPDANTTFLIANGNATIDVPTLTANRTYTLGAAGAIAGDILFVVMRSTSGVLTVTDGATSAVLAVMASGGPNSILADSTWGEFLFTGSVWVRRAGDILRQQLSWTFQSTGVWVCPPGVNEVRLEGWGGGGAGGNGLNGSTTSNVASCGGGGGGGAVRAMGRMRVTPGLNYNITIGAGGLYDTIGGDGNDGEDTSFFRIATGLKFTATGAQGGSRGKSTTQLVASRGGGSNRNTTNNKSFLVGDPFTLSVYPSCPSNGGTGLQVIGGVKGTDGVGSVEGGAGGTGGATGTTGTSYSGGGGGGGGGGGCTDVVSLGSIQSVGGAGGAGGNGTPGTGTNGTTGASGVANTGAGGGGGGGGGSAGAPGAGAIGGNGGSGMLIIYGVH